MKIRNRYGDLIFGGEFMDNTPFLEEYYAQNAKKIRNLVDKLLYGFGGVAQKDYDDFYSLVF